MVALPILAESLSIDLAQEGIEIVNLRGKGKLSKLEGYLRYLKDSHVVPFVILDRNKEVKEWLNQWSREGILPEGNYRVWPKEFEDLFPLEEITQASNELGYTEITKENLERTHGEGSVVQSIKKLLHDNSQKDLDKRELAELLAERIYKGKAQIPKDLEELLKTLVTKANAAQGG